MTVEAALGIGGLLVSLAVALFVFIPAIKKSRTDAKVVDVQAHAAAAAEDDQIASRRLVELNRLYERVGELEEKDRKRDAEFQAFRDRTDATGVAFANVLRDAADQWPKDHPGPVFQDEDIAVLGDTIPPDWLRRSRRRPRPA